MQSASLVLLSQQQALERALDVVANNVANANTTAFKRVGIEFNSFLQQTGPELGQSMNLVVDRPTYRDTSNGAIQSTGNQLDLAIQGEGYFQVRGADGNTHYTRNGSFQLNNQGQITTLSGQVVLSDGGQAITVPDTTTEINVASNGFITARVDNGTNLTQLGKIGLVKFDNDNQVQSEGAGLYTTSQAAIPVQNGGIVQGGLEQSNVQSITEMSNMLQVYRSYERTTNLISQDTTRQNDAITKLAKTTI